MGAEVDVIDIMGTAGVKPQKKGRSPDSLGPLQVTLWLACRWGDSDAAVPSSTADASTISRWSVIDYMPGSRSHS